MSLSLENTGYCAFGTPPGAQPPTANVPAPEGAEFPPAGVDCVVTLKYKRGAKLTKAEAKGKDGAKTTFSGKHVSEVTLELEWTDLPDIDGPMVEALQAIDPEGENAGKAWDWTERDAWNTTAVMVEEMDGPTREKGSDKVTCKLKLSGWKKPDNSGAGSGTTPNAADPYTVHGGALDGVTFPSKPAVTP